ncbi:N-acetylmuramoyl-L-alanine amidase [Streptomyces orinoci]|uniref:N-acetylmuramoyl-L-alanine amidase n=1 Tax=Streptomyces orinoci TaxID=67339 RepID=A0ABV3JVG1_STRON|nr:N-acetylmuramoyl-L-alanine amidase [Streptomyces orinoci]
MSTGSLPRILRPLRAAALTTLLLAGVAACGGEGHKSSASDASTASPKSAEPRPSSAAPADKGAAGKGSTSKTAPAEEHPGDGPLKGKVVVIDPGHNIHNQDHPAEINRQVEAGNGRKECDTTGTATNSGYAEATFSLDVAHRIRRILQAQGATVTLTHDGDRPYGPCVDERAEIGNKAHADASVSVHADGAAPGDRGFHVILPALVKNEQADTSAIVGPSRELGERIAGNFVRVTGSAPSNYVGKGTGLDVRGDLGGLNLSKVPKVFIECGNMRDPDDAAQLTDEAWREKAAQGIANGISDFLHG